MTMNELFIDNTQESIDAALKSGFFVVFVWEQNAEKYLFLSDRFPVRFCITFGHPERVISDARTDSLTADQVVMAMDRNEADSND
jgi:hypothetical protein